MFIASFVTRYYFNYYETPGRISMNLLSTGSNVYHTFSRILLSSQRITFFRIDIRAEYLDARAPYDYPLYS